MKRMRLFVNGLIEQCNRHELDAELILVEWNPPPEDPPLRDVLPKPTEKDRLAIRYIVVPPELHQKYKRSLEIPLYQMIAKNVGIRRAKGEFVLCTNVDLIFSDELIQMISQKKLKKNMFYRANRVDIKPGIDEQAGFDEQIEYCKSNIIRRNGLDQRFIHLNLDDSGMHSAFYFSKWCFNIISFILMLRFEKVKRIYSRLDKMACGDFTLMHRDVWNDIQGYVELDLYSIHVDSLALAAARALGYSQYIFPVKACCYHIDHPQGWSSMNPIEKMKFIEERPTIGFGVFWETAIYLLKNKCKVNINKKDWGFTDEIFEEYVF